MAILVKVKDSTNDRTDFTYIRNDKVNEFDKSDYILQEITQKMTNSYSSSTPGIPKHSHNSRSTIPEDAESSVL